MRRPALTLVATVNAVLLGAGPVAGQGVTQPPVGSDTTRIRQVVLGVAGGPLSALISTPVNEPDADGGFVQGYRSPDAGAWWLDLFLKARAGKSLVGRLDLVVAQVREQVGSAGGGACGVWVLNNSGIGTCMPTGQDVYFATRTAGVRIGAEYHLATRGVRPWIGLMPGFFYWRASYENSAGDGAWGDVSGVSFGLSLTGGVDLVIGRFNLTGFYERGGPADPEPQFPDLFYAGWTGHASVGPLGHARFGVGVGVGL